MTIEPPLLSLVVPSRDEAENAGESLRRILARLDALVPGRFELIVADFSSDPTPNLVEALAAKRPEVRLVRVGGPGLGRGLREGFLAARGRLAMAYPMDCAWTLDAIDDSLAAGVRGDAVVIASRNVPGATVRRPWKRTLFSRAYNLAVRLLLGLRVKDTQATVLFPLDRLRPAISALGSDGPFFQTQLLLAALDGGVRIVEVPGHVVDERGEDSKIRPVRHGWRMLRELLAERRLRRSRGARAPAPQVPVAPPPGWR